MKTRLESFVVGLLFVAGLIFAIIGIHYSIHETDILAESRGHGYDEGYEAGYDEGYEDGHLDGYYEGYENAYDDAYYEGYQDGHAKGLRGAE